MAWQSNSSSDSQYERSTVTRNLHVLVATPLGKRGKGGIDRIMDELRTELNEQPPSNLVVRFSSTRGPTSIFLSPFFLIIFLLNMLYLRSIGQLDILHLNLASKGSTWRKMTIGLFATIFHVPYVIHLHGAVYHSFFATLGHGRRNAVRSFFRHAASTIVLGKRWRQFVAREILGTDKKIIELPNASTAFDLPDNLPRENNTILFLGRLCDRKGVFELLQALRKIDKITDWRAILAGDGELNRTREAVLRLGLEDQVTVPGWVDPDEVRNLIMQADIFVLPSRNENLPMSVVEAMAAGLAIITTPVGAIEDIIVDGETGLLVPVGDVSALASALNCLINDSALRHQLGRAAAQFHREHLEISSYTRRLVHIWRQTLV